MQTINFKQQYLIENLYNLVKAKFPEIRLINITNSPDSSEHIWINVTAPEDEDRQIELSEFAAEKGHDILLDYGYWISVIQDKADTVVEKKFYNSEQFKSVISDAIADYQSGKTADMDILA